MKKFKNVVIIFIGVLLLWCNVACAEEIKTMTPADVFQFDSISNLIHSEGFSGFVKAFVQIVIHIMRFAGFIVPFFLLLLTFVDFMAMSDERKMMYARKITRIDSDFNNVSGLKRERRIKLFIIQRRFIIAIIFFGISVLISMKLGLPINIFD